MTTGIPELDRILNGIRASDNVVWEADSGASVDLFVSKYIFACEAEGAPVVYVSFNRSPQTIADIYSPILAPGRFFLVDCFTTGKGDRDESFNGFYQMDGPGASLRAFRVEEPSNPARVQDVLLRAQEEAGPRARYVFDSLTGMLDLWKDPDTVFRFFGHHCPRLFDLKTVAYWLLEQDAHSREFLAKIRHVTQVVIEVGVNEGMQTLTVRKAANRNCLDVGVPRCFHQEGRDPILSAESREDRELRLLTALGEALDSALDPAVFFQQTMHVLFSELGMIRGTLVLLDRIANKLRIAAAHGLSAVESARGEYEVGEGVTGHVVRTGLPEVVPDISRDPRFLDRTNTRQAGSGAQIAFICVPLKVDGEVVGALSADRLFANQVILDKDLRLLKIAASAVSQVLKINQMAHVEKEEILHRDERLIRELRDRYRLDNVTGQSKAIQKVLATAAMAAKSSASVIIHGETGTGKELIANVVHFNSARAKGPFVKVNCGALTETLLESELFGHVRGSFTGAVKDRKGRFALADGGTLFLDEVSEMSPALQVKILRVIQEMEFEPVGGTQTLRVDVRLVAATNKDLRKGIQEGWFREDLYYRLNVVPIHIPPLRERREDILPLTNHFLDLYNRRCGKKVGKLSRKVLDLLVGYGWPGNARELENCIERAVVMCPGDTFTVELLPPEITGPRQGAGGSPAGIDAAVGAIEKFCRASDNPGEIMRRLIAAVEKAAIQKVVSLGLGQREIAERLGMSRMTLRKKMKELGIKSR